MGQLHLCFLFIREAGHALSRFTSGPPWHHHVALQHAGRMADWKAESVFRNCRKTRVRRSTPGPRRDPSIGSMPARIEQFRVRKSFDFMSASLTVLASAFCAVGSFLKRVIAGVWFSGRSLLGSSGRLPCPFGDASVNSTCGRFSEDEIRGREFFQPGKPVLRPVCCLIDHAMSGPSISS